MEPAISVQDHNYTYMFNFEQVIGVDTGLFHVWLSSLFSNWTESDMGKAFKE